MTFKEKEAAFTKVLHDAAKELGRVFIKDSAKGRNLELENIHIEDVAGWLSPIDEAEDHRKDDKWYCTAKWHLGGKRIEFDFVQYSLDGDAQILATTKEDTRADIVPRYAYLGADDLDKAIEFELSEENV